jgi:hypothetical protein
MFVQDIERNLMIKSSLDQVWFKIYLDLEVQCRYLKTTMRISMKKDPHKRRKQLNHILMDAMDLDTLISKRDLKDWADSIELEYLRLAKGEYDRKTLVLK